MNFKKWLEKLGLGLGKKPDAVIDQTTMLEIQKVESYFNDEHLIDFVRKYEALRLLKKEDHYFATMGINFRNESVDSVKFYAHILEELTEDEVLDFIPSSVDYEKFRHLKSKGNSISKNNVGTVFEVKYKSTAKEPTFGFFYVLENSEKSYKEIGEAKGLPQNIRKNCISLGINFEYTSTNRLYKRYYFFDGEEEKTYFESRVGIPLLGFLVEYAEGDGLSKVNNYSGLIEDFWDKDRNFSENEHNVIRFLCKKYNLSVMSYGKHENQSVRSIYFREGIKTKDDLRNLREVRSNIFRCVING